MFLVAAKENLDRQINKTSYKIKQRNWKCEIKKTEKKTEDKYQEQRTEKSTISYCIDMKTVSFTFILIVKPLKK